MCDKKQMGVHVRVSKRDQSAEAYIHAYTHTHVHVHVHVHTSDCQVREIKETLEISHPVNFL